ncbi:flavin reductase family protein [Mycobacterium sp. E740]|uniref:flavin reductase family protein n=1 Tax=Mycobacterium sp. E740 TaxID=1834149 RepID=UPI0007FBDE2A|nr:flavin reductase family protein [Mycobacterium sp. E740]OBI82060.1 flavin reductase [Mycobacterium sp. E740]
MQSGTAPFEDIVSLLNYPMFIVTTHADAENSGCLVGFASQTSINPPRFLVGLSRRNRTFRIAQSATHLAVHLVSREHLQLAQLFGGETGDHTDKFARCDWHTGPEQMPILDDAAAWFVGEVVRRFDVGDHMGHLLEPVAGEPPSDLEQWVTFADVRELEPGHDA